MEDALARMEGTVVTEAPGTSNEWASYDSIYRIVADAIEQDAAFGSEYNLEVFGEDLAPSESFVEGDLAGALSSLLSNDTVGDQLRGATWSERTSEHVGLTEDGSAIRFLLSLIHI